MYRHPISLNKILLRCITQTKVLQKMIVTGRQCFMLVTKNSDGHCMSKYLIEASNRTDTTVDELLLHVSMNSNRNDLHVIPHSMVNFD